uniref:Photosystem I assembly protein Ycf4 n=1 Tax=Aegilops tauschii subsp. strangulata TaxID=200361 RepID=A0A452YKH8_AEGTS
MNWRSEHIWVELLKGSRKRGNFFWACILFLVSLGFLSVGISSYLGKNIIYIYTSISRNSFFSAGDRDVFLRNRKPMH